MTQIDTRKQPAASQTEHPTQSEPVQSSASHAIDSLKGIPLTEEQLDELQTILAQHGRHSEVSAKQEISESLIIADQIVQSMRFENEFVHVCIPAGVSDEAALKGLNEYFRVVYPEQNRNAVDESSLEWLIERPCVTERDINATRMICVQVAVDEAGEKNRAAQALAIQKATMSFAQPIEQVFVLAAYACLQGENLIHGLMLRCAVPGVAVAIQENNEVCIVQYADKLSHPACLASGVANNVS